MPTDGSRANKTGKQLETFIRNLLIECGYQRVERNSFGYKTKTEQLIFTEQYDVGKGIYGKPRKCDFIVYNPQRWQDCLVIESKWQQSGGSVDEKFPFLVQCIQKAGYATIVVLDGGGYSDGAKQWLMSQEGVGCLKRVLNMSQLQKFANNDLL